MDFSKSYLCRSEYRKWGLLCSFVVTAVILGSFLCHFQSRNLSEELTSLSEFGAGGIEDEIKWLPFTNVVDAFTRWDENVGCPKFRAKHSLDWNMSRPLTLQDPESISCNQLKKKHVNILVKSWTWIPDSLNNFYSCRCGLSCLWTKSLILADKADAFLYEWTKPPMERLQDEPLRIYIELEADRQRAPSQDIFVSYHHSSDVQATYAGGLFHNTRSYYVSPEKNEDVLVYWSSSRCVDERQKLAREFLGLISHHSFGKCLNNVGGGDAALQMYPICRDHHGQQSGSWNQHLHCAMSHYKFVLAIENTKTESYVTEKLFYALDAGSIPIYFGAENVLDLVPPHSIIDGNSFSSMESLATFVKQVANDSVKYAEYHAWRRCGVMGNYYWTRFVSLDTLPCRLCAHVSSL